MAVFQDDKNPSSGVACFDGQRVRPFESRTSLPSDVIWVSTSDRGETAQNFRSNNYLRCTIGALADDLGVELRDVVEGMPKMARLLNQVQQIALACYQWSDPITAWSKPNLAEVLREALPRQGEVSTTVVPPLRDALQSFSWVPDHRHQPGLTTPTCRYTLRHNRLEYAQYLMSQGVPSLSASWYHLRDVDVEDLLDPARPSLAEVALEFDPPTGENPVDYSRLAAFGASLPGGKPARGKMRRWVAQPELAWLVKHAHVHVSTALVCNSPLEPIAPTLALPEVLRRSDPLLSLSLAAGVVAESHWVGLSMARRKRRDHTGASAVWEDVFSPTAVWLRAYDRAYSYFMAEQAAEKGYDVVGYGYGSVILQADKYEPMKLQELADHLGVCHPNLIASQNKVALGGSDVDAEA